ncbi:uncharacterized protein [Typha angustifolia]|uniref:uncharacterized protein n=1 Tax=Typha angustifolia TaxID=59011 RepID=UPI003C307F94
MAMVRNYTDVSSDNSDESSHDDWWVHFHAGDDPMLGSYDPHIARPSIFSKFHQKKFQKKYKEIDDAIRNYDWTDLQKLVSEKFILNDEEMNLSDTVNLSDDPLLSIVVAYQKSNLALRLVEVMSEENLRASNIYGDTVLHMAAATGDVRLVEAIVMKWQNLMWSRNRKLEIPLHKAALYGQRDVF